jgi:hypothetical protein
LESNAFILSGNPTTVFDTGYYKIDEIQANIEVNSVDSVFESINFQWVAENASWVYFTLLIRSVVFVMLVSLLVSFRRALPKENYEPTYMHSFISRFTFVFAAAFAPIPEILRFFEISKGEGLFDYFDVVSTNLILAFFIISAWDLTVHNTEREAKFVEKMTLGVVLVIILLTIPNGVKFSDGELQNFMENWLPLFVVLICTLTLVLVPDNVKRAQPEYPGSLIHLFFCFPSVFSNVYLRVNEEKRPSKLGLLSALLMSLSFAFILFLHWPQEATDSYALYTPMEQDKSKKRKQSSDDDDDNNRTRARKIIKV